jgi:hypothetical protein
MRRVALVVLAAVATAGTAVAAALPASANQVPPTRVITVRPVNASGHAAPGYTITSNHDFQVDCRLREPSPGAVSPNIEWCSPTVAYPVACWNAAAPHRVLCLQDARRSNLMRYARTGRFAPTSLAAPDKRAPLWIRLADGDFCSFRAGGAWPQLPGHPRLFGTYSCQHDGAVWATLSAAHYGVEESRASWTVLTAQFGHHHLVTRHVARAFFVGTLTR